MSEWLKEAERIGDEASAYGEWVECNEEDILEQWINTDPEAPEEIFEGVLDDDYPDTYEMWANDLSIDDVPDEFVQQMYESYCEGNDSFEDYCTSGGKE